MAGLALQCPIQKIEPVLSPEQLVVVDIRWRAEYVARISIAAHALVQARLLLNEDLERYVARAIGGDDFPGDPKA